MPIIWGLTDRETWEVTMANLDKGGTVTLQELVVSSLAHTDAVAKLLC